MPTSPQERVIDVICGRGRLSACQTLAKEMCLTTTNLEILESLDVILTALVSDVTLTMLQRARIAGLVCCCLGSIPQEWCFAIPEYDNHHPFGEEILCSHTGPHRIMASVDLRPTYSVPLQVPYQCCVAECDLYRNHRFLQHVFFGPVIHCDTNVFTDFVLDSLAHLVSGFRAVTSLATNLGPGDRNKMLDTWLDVLRVPRFVSRCVVDNIFTELWAFKPFGTGILDVGIPAELTVPFAHIFGDRNADVSTEVIQWPQFDELWNLITEVVTFINSGQQVVVCGSIGPSCSTDDNECGIEVR